MKIYLIYPNDIPGIVFNDNQKQLLDFPCSDEQELLISQGYQLNYNCILKHKLAYHICVLHIASAYHIPVCPLKRRREV